ncbi:MAG: alpha amylase C-terminal domain-containing protein, partial [Verrucomicrobiota bacterium]
LFMGCEFGQSSEWKYDGSLDWHLLQYTDHEGVQRIVRDLNHFYQQNPSLAQFDNDPQGFQWINGGDSENSALSFLRLGKTPQETFAVVANLTPVPRIGYRIGIPQAGYWKELINTNADVYGGTGAGLSGGVVSDPIPWDGREHSLHVDLPGLSTFILRFEG